MKRLFFIGLMLLSAFSLHAEEGMWLPALIGETKLQDMRTKGLKLKATDLYDEDKASLKDAIVYLGGCTGEMISKEGLFITNHHCGYSQIQSHSTIKNDYLTHGFFAMNRRQELPNPGYTASFLIRTEEATDRILAGITDMPDTIERTTLIKQRCKAMADSVLKQMKGKGYRASVESMLHSNQYFLFVSRTYTDVRLVAAPPSSIGKFGGDTDNWMWPRHTGDFCIFRIYADSLNNPTDYSADNVPYIPKKSLTISTKGIREGDFTFIYGYPARTNEYLISDAVDYIANKSNPRKIEVRTKRLEVMNAYQNSDPKVRIQYAAKNASVSNAWKKWQGEMKGIVRLGAIPKKKVQEAAFERWAVGKPQYERLLPRMRYLYNQIEPLTFATEYYNETIKAIEAINFVSGFLSPITTDKQLSEQKRRAVAFFKNYHHPIDREIAKAMISFYTTNLPPKFHPQEVIERKSNLNEWIDSLYDHSIFTCQETTMALLNGDLAELNKVIKQDPLVIVCRSFTNIFNNKISVDQTKSANAELTDLYRLYMKGLMEMEPDRLFYPDANSSLRIAYGCIEGFRPNDGVSYAHYTTLDGIMEKDDPNIYDYDVPEKLRDLYRRKDYGRWAWKGSVPVAFIASNHTTGGNSGSPVLNAEGELIGVNFDRCWESTMSDIIYDRHLCRNIAVDIRFVLFILDKYAGAGYLLNEMNIAI